MANGNQLPEGFQLDTAPQLPPGFEIDSSPQAAPQPGVMDKVNQAIVSNPVGRLGAEAGAGIGRSLAGFADSVTTDPINETIRLMGGPEKFFQGIQQYLNQNIGIDQSYMKGDGVEGVARDYVVKPTSELAPGFLGGGAALRGVAKAVPKATVMAPTTTTQNVVRQLGTTTAAEDLGYGALSAVGGETGRAADQALGGSGEIGEMVGAIAAPLAPALRSLPGRAKAAAEPFDTTAPPPQTGPYRSPDTGLAVEPPSGRPARSVPPSQQSSPMEEINLADTPLPKKAQIRQAILSGDKMGAKYKLDPKGNVVKDAVAEKTISQGFDERTVATIKRSSPEDRLAMNQMLSRAESSLNNATQGARNRPSDVIGNSVMKRWDAVKKANRDAGQDIQKSINKVQNERVELEDVSDAFADDLDSLGVSYELTNKGLKLDFKGSQIEGNSAVAPIKRVYDRLKTSDTAGNLQDLKKYIDSQINWNKSPDKPLDAQAVQVLKKLREGINQKLRGLSDDYANANDRFSETIQAMNGVADVMGTRFDPTGEGADALVGQEMRKVLSNYAKRDPMTRAVDQLDAVAAKYGAQFNDDPIHQVVFYNDLERMFGSFSPNSMQGVMDKSGERVAKRLISGGTSGGIAEGVDLMLGKAFDAARGLNKENAIKAMRELLRQQ